MTTYTASSIMKCLMTMDEKKKERAKEKLDLCYVMAKECLSFIKCPTLHRLEVSHGVDLGPAYKTDVAAKSFTHYITESQRQTYLSFLSNEVDFFSSLLDGSTDAGNAEDELVFIHICKQDDVAMEMKSCARYFTVFNPEKTDNCGLVNGLRKPLEKISGLSDCLDKRLVLSAKPIVVGGGSDSVFCQHWAAQKHQGKISKSLTMDVLVMRFCASAGNSIKKWANQSFIQVS